MSVSAIVGGAPDPGGSGGGASSVPQRPVVGFSGYAYPNATVVLLKNAARYIETTADDRGFFSLSLEEQYEQNILYGLYAEDTENERSTLLNYPLVVTQGAFTQVSGIVFAPTITSDVVAVRSGTPINISGQARPSRSIVVSIQGPTSENSYTIQSLQSGKFSLALSTTDLSDGEHLVSVRYEGDRRISKVLKIIVGDKTILRSQDIVTIPGDCNKDTIIDLRDFSVLAFWYLRSNPPLCVDTNADGIIDIVDFSILAYYWTG